MDFTLLEWTYRVFVRVGFGDSKERLGDDFIGRLGENLIGRLEDDSIGRLGVSRLSFKNGFYLQGRYFD